MDAIAAILWIELATIGWLIIALLLNLPWGHP